jgi:hypothetical protein
MRRTAKFLEPGRQPRSVATILLHIQVFTTLLDNHERVTFRKQLKNGMVELEKATTYPSANKGLLRSYMQSQSGGCVRTKSMQGQVRQACERPPRFRRRTNTHPIEQMEEKELAFTRLRVGDDVHLGFPSAQWRASQGET